MDRDKAYLLVASELENWRLMPFDDLVATVGTLVLSQTVQIGQELVDVEVRVRWSNEKRRDICIDATAYGPSSHRIDKVEETVTIKGVPGLG